MDQIARYLHLKNFHLYNLAFWSLLFLLDLLRTYAFSHTFNYPFEAPYIIRWPFSIYLAYWILSPLVFRAFIYTLTKKKISFWIVHLSGSFVFGVLHKAMFGTIAILLERLFLGDEIFDWEVTIQNGLTTYYDVFTGVALYWIIILILTGLGYYRKFNEQYISLMDVRNDLGLSQLKSMKMQLHPHFLFNAFNTIVMMIRGRKNQEAIEMISSLSDMLRQSLSREAIQFVTLREEIELLKKYLMIESIRYRDRLNIAWDIDEECLKYQVPGFVLQPIVENAFKHGISKNPGKSEIKISAGEEAGTLILSVFNSGSTWSADWLTSGAPGIGLTNTIQRLTKLYKGGFKLLINQHMDGVNVKIRLPAENPVNYDPTDKV